MYVATDVEIREKYSSFHNKKEEFLFPSIVKERNKLINKMNRPFIKARVIIYKMKWKREHRSIRRIGNRRDG